MKVRLNKRIAQKDERPNIVHNIRWCRKHHQSLAGLPFIDDAASGSGIELNLIVPSGTSREHIEQALREGYRERDVIRHGVIECPTGWFAQAKVNNTVPKEVGRA